MKFHKPVATVLGIAGILLADNASANVLKTAASPFKFAGKQAGKAASIAAKPFIFAGNQIGKGAAYAGNKTGVVAVSKFAAKPFIFAGRQAGIGAGKAAGFAGAQAAELTELEQLPETRFEPGNNGLFAELGASGNLGSIDSGSKTNQDGNEVDFNSTGQLGLRKSGYSNFSGRGNIGLRFGKHLPYITGSYVREGFATKDKTNGTAVGNTDVATTEKSLGVGYRKYGSWKPIGNIRIGLEAEAVLSEKEVNEIYDILNISKKDRLNKNYRLGWELAGKFLALKGRYETGSGDSDTAVDMQGFGNLNDSRQDFERNVVSGEVEATPLRNVIITAGLGKVNESYGSGAEKVASDYVTGKIGVGYVIPIPGINTYGKLSYMHEGVLAGTTGDSTLDQVVNSFALSVNGNLDDIAGRVSRIFK